MVESMPRGPINGAIIPSGVVIATVASRIEPIRAPKIITIPILVNVPENPLPITPAISVTGIPPIIPKTVETNRMDGF